jgi:hypothetical protein
VHRRVHHGQQPVAGQVGEGLSVSDVLTPAERKLFIRKPEWAKALLPVCEAMKQSAFDTAVIADIMSVLQDEPELPSKFYIVDNRYLVPSTNTCYDLHLAERIDRLPYWPFRFMHVAFRIYRDENQVATEPLGVGEDGPRS